jgi:hypothetical protein
MLKQFNRGGKRPFSGAKPKYNEETTTIAFRVPKSKVFEIKELVKNKLKEYENNNK